MAEPRIQLWTDDTNSEFAIYLNSDYVIRTNQKIKYTKMIDESVCMQGYNYDWKHTLTQWVTFLFGNNLQISPEKFEISGSPLDLIESTETKKKNIQKIKYPRKALLIKSRQKLEVNPRPALKPKLLKCTFCNLKYYIDEERIEHEKFWHSDKIASI